MSSLAIEADRPVGAATPWRAHLTLLGLVAAALLVLFHRDAADMAAIWWTSSTFNHCLLIIPLIFWLVWQRRRELAALTPAAWWPGLLAVGIGAFGWLVGEAAGVAFARHLGLVVMLQGAVIACLGKAAARGLAFPLFYAFFLVPAGEEIVPVMQTVTALIAAFILDATGVPAHLEGIFITTPVGYFEVAEACAGVKFLIAMLAFGALVANVCFKSWPRRIAFLAACIVVPILANGARAWGTIYVAELSGSTVFAESFDHVVYGGVFFAVVIALILGGAWRFFDRGIDEPWFDPEALQGPAPRGARPQAVAAAALALALAAPAWSQAVAAAGAQAPPADIAMPDVPGWQQVPATGGIPWAPHFAGADLIRTARYRAADGREVDLAIAVFARQSEGRELIGFGQGAVAPDGAWAWTAPAAAPPGGRAERIASRGVAREVVTFYRVGDVVTGSGARVKLETLKARLIGGPQRAVAVMVSAEAPAAGDSPRPAIDAFLAALGPVAPLADRAAGIE